MKKQNDLLTGSLMVRESRHLARLIRSGASKDLWDQAIIRDNILQKPTEATAARVARGLRRRLEPLDGGLLEAIENGDDELVRQTTLCAVLLQSPILLTFFEDVVANATLYKQAKLELYQWDDHVRENAALDPSILNWSETSLKKARQIVVRILWESGFLSDTRTRRLQKVVIHIELKALLIKLGLTRVAEALALNKIRR